MSNIDPREYIRQVREQTIDGFCESLQQLRSEHGAIATEMLIESSLKHDDASVRPMRIDALVEASQQAVMISGGEVSEGVPVGVFEVGGQSVRLYSFAWDACIIWFRHDNFAEHLLQDWTVAALDVQNVNTPGADGLRGVVHYVGEPRREAGGWLLEIDFGSAPLAVFDGLLQRLIDLGATRLQVGYSSTGLLPENLAARLEREELTPESFHDLMLEAIRSLDTVSHAEIKEAWQIDVRGKGEKSDNQVYLGNVWQRIQRAPAEARALEVGRVLRMLCETSSAAKDQAPDDLAQLRPVLRHVEFLQQLSQRTTTPIPVVQRPFVADMLLLCVWDQPNGMRFTLADDVAAFGLSAEAALDRALANYRAEHPEPELHDDGPVTVVRTQDAYESSLLLDDDFWNKQSATVSGTIVAAIPARDILLFTTTERPNGIASLRAAVARIMQAGDHVISDALLVRRDGGWQAFVDDAPPAKKPWFKFW